MLRKRSSEQDDISIYDQFVYFRVLTDNLSLFRPARTKKRVVRRLGGERESERGLLQSECISTHPHTILTDISLSTLLLPLLLQSERVLHCVQSQHLFLFGVYSHITASD